MRKPCQILEVYVATGSKNVPSTLKVQEKSVKDLLDYQNARERSTFRSPIVFRPLDDEAWSLKRLWSLNWSAENDFRKRPVVLCVIDGEAFSNFIREIFTIRAHHFPRYDGQLAFCITNPAAALRTEYGDDLTEEKAFKVLREKIFRCELVPATDAAFLDFVRSVRIVQQISDRSLDQFFGGR